MDNELVEAVARAIYETDNGLGGDCVADLIYENFCIRGANVAEMQEQTMNVCRAAAQAALAATPLASLKAENEALRSALYDALPYLDRPSVMPTIERDRISAALTKQGA